MFLVNMLFPKKKKEKKNMEILTKNLNQFISLCQSC